MPFFDLKRAYADHIKSLNAEERKAFGRNLMQAMQDMRAARVAQLPPRKQARLPAKRLPEHSGRQKTTEHFFWPRTAAANAGSDPDEQIIRTLEKRTASAVLFQIKGCQKRSTGFPFFSN